jgi:WD repeat-containing protein 26
MLPENRLAVLLQQVKDYQIGICYYHTDARPLSLYSDHYCERHNFPTDVLHELPNHTGEIWQVKFSHDGSRLASCGGDNHVFIWNVPGFDNPVKLDGHDGGVGNVSWSPDDTMLVTCGRDHFAKIWDTSV